MIVRIFAVCAFMISAAAPVSAQDLEGDALYQVTTLRAAPGKLEDLLSWTAEMKASGYFNEAGEHPPLVMRHSQGDQWDLLKIAPMKSWTAYHSKKAARAREKATAKYADELAPGFALVAFAEDHFAYGPPIEDLNAAFEANGFFHVEMFKAAPGKAAELIDQRRKENSYLVITGQTPNMIFRRAAGSDIDVFTIGFHESLQAFAARAPVTIAEKEEAAKAAGFKDLDDISYYLRSLISGHHDTLAVKVK